MNSYHAQVTFGLLSRDAIMQPSRCGQVAATWLHFFWRPFFDRGLNTGGPAPAQVGGGGTESGPSQREEENNGSLRVMAG